MAKCTHSIMETPNSQNNFYGQVALVLNFIKCNFGAASAISKIPLTSIVAGQKQLKVFGEHQVQGLIICLSSVLCFHQTVSLSK